MSAFKQRVAIPENVEIERLFDVKLIDNGTSEIQFFTSNPSRVVTDNNYSQNPLPGTKNRVILGISINATVAIITESADVKPAKVVNQLKDGTLTLSTNEGRDQNFIHPIKDYMNLSGIQVAAASEGGTPTRYTAAALQATGMRQTDNLFYMKPNESFTLKVNFASSVWPTTANWTSLGVGRFGLEAELYVANMTDAQLAEYIAKVGRV